MLLNLSRTLPAASLAFGLLAFSGHLSSAKAESVNPPVAKTYANLTSPAGDRASMAANSAQEMPRVEGRADATVTWTDRTHSPYPPAEELGIFEHPTAP
jgi:hypothetical protein